MASSNTTAVISGNRVTAERRAAEERRSDQESEKARERRNGDRRRTIHGIEYITADSLSGIQEWLEENCQGRWSLALESMDEDRIRKTVRILFEDLKDKQMFMTAFQPR